MCGFHSYAQTEPLLGSSKIRTHWLPRYKDRGICNSLKNEKGSVIG